jgi:hypothetical protein
MSENITGSCLCRSVKYTIKGQFKAVANCHCNTCKKVIGGAFETLAFIDENNFELIEGQDTLTAYQISENATKNFCRTCGTPIFNSYKKYPGNCMVQVGSLDDPSIVAPAVNVFCESMLPWVQGIADLKCFEREPTK